MMEEMRIKKSKKGNNNILMLIALSIVLFLACMSIKTFVLADQKNIYEKSFISIEIQEGDTLIGIANQYALSNREVSSYINEVKSINNLETDTIHAGCYLLIPIFEEQ